MRILPRIFIVCLCCLGHTYMALAGNCSTIPGGEQQLVMRAKGKIKYGEVGNNLRYILCGSDSNMCGVGDIVLDSNLNLLARCTDSGFETAQLDSIPTCDIDTAERNLATYNLCGRVHCEDYKIRTYKGKFIVYYSPKSSTSNALQQICVADSKLYNRLKESCEGSGGTMASSYGVQSCNCNTSGDREQFRCTTTQNANSSTAPASTSTSTSTSTSSSAACDNVGTKDSVGYYICEQDTDCTKEKHTLPSHATAGVCKSVGRQCNVCVARECEDKFTIKKINGAPQGYCITAAEQGCNDTNGKWDKRKKQCDCGTMKWDTEQNKCITDEPVPESAHTPTDETPDNLDEYAATTPEVNTECTDSGGEPGENETCTCDVSKGLTKNPNTSNKCICSEEGKTYDADQDMCVETPTEPVAPEITEKPCGGGVLNEDGTCNCDADDAHLVPTEDGSCDCADGYHRDEDTNACVKNEVPESTTNPGTSVSTNEGNLKSHAIAIPSKDALKEAEDKYKKAKDTEQSLANRTLTAASTAATGVGLMTAASAKAEQKADEDAEQDMSAYLATFRCEYGRGQSTKAGNEEITLPGGNELLTYYSEYKSLADNLKNTKKALGMRKGIESEVVYDKAESSLYKYSSVGKTDGAYTSLSRALTDSDGADAAEWNAQKDKTAKKLKGGAIAAGAGVAGGVTGNAVMNTDMIQNIKDKFKGSNTESD